MTEIAAELAGTVIRLLILNESLVYVALIELAELLYLGELETIHSYDTHHLGRIDSCIEYVSKGSKELLVSAFEIDDEDLGYAERQGIEERVYEVGIGLFIGFATCLSLLGFALLAGTAHLMV
jgi:hypothetical protein